MSDEEETMTISVKKAMVLLAIMFSIPGVIMAVTDTIWFLLSMIVIAIGITTLHALRHEED